jgi:hypothetical protein
MKRIILSLILTLGFTFLITPVANADTVTFPCGGSATYSVLMPQGVLLDGKKCNGALVIDSSVKIIDLTAFNNANITSVVIPSSVTSIGDYAFAGAQLSSVSIPNSVINLGTGAFQRTQLSSVIIPNSLTSISSGLFSSTKLTDVVIPNSVTSIEGAAFASTPLTSVTIPNSVTRIGNSAFAGTNLTSVTIPNSVTWIGAEAFSGNLLLTLISIPDGVAYIGEKIFDRNYSLASIIYCGQITGFPIMATCPPDRKALIDAKLAADKVTADKSLSNLQARIKSTSAAFSQLDAEVDSLMKKYPSMKTNLNLYKKKIALFDEINEKNIGTAELNLAGLTSKIVSIKATYIKIARSLTCIKGSKTVKVVDVKPVCPKGYKKK